MHRLALAFMTTTLFAASQPALMPWPSHYQEMPGNVSVGPLSIVFAHSDPDPALRQAAMRLRDRWPTGPALRVTYGKPLAQTQAYGEDESYKLSVKPTGAILTAPTALGVLRGFATLEQLLTPSGTIPAVEIEDSPRFGWRGLHIDVARHFFPVAIIKRNLDGMAAVKLNVFHWHLSDNQGFRVESKRYPKLQEQGSDGLFYTQDQVRDVIRYAHDRGIRVVPEFDVPGHTTAWLVGYPELAAGPGPFQIGRTWGVFDPAMDPTNEQVYTFLDNLIREMAALFPDDYFHIGGDEVNGLQWNRNPRITQFKRDHGMLGPGTPTKAQQTASNEKLQAYFNSRIEPLVRKHGKKMMGWDEILAPTLPKTIVIQSWQGQESLGAAVRQGFEGVLSAGYYLDLIQPARQHYLVDPMIDPKTKKALVLTPEQQARILGGEACMWSEYVSEETVDSRIWPRTAAIAERFWSPAATRDLNSMYARLDGVSRKLDSFGLTHNSSYDPILNRLAPGSDLHPLADYVEPVKGYARSSSGINYTQQTPLNRLVDAARPESAATRHFIAEIAAHNWPAVRATLTAWKAFQLPPTPILKEAVPVAQNLNTLGAIGLEALDYQAKAQHPPADWVTAKLAKLQTMKKPQAELLLMPVDPVIALLKSL